MYTANDTLGDAIRARLPDATDTQLLHIFDKGLKLFEHEKLSQKITYIINYLAAPSKGNVKRHDMVPSFWHNAPKVEQFDLHEIDNTYSVYVTSYIGVGETDAAWFDIPKIWVESDNWKSLIDHEVIEQQRKIHSKKLKELENSIESQRALYEQLRAKFENPDSI